MPKATLEQANPTNDQDLNPEEENLEEEMELEDETPELQPSDAPSARGKGNTKRTRLILSDENEYVHLITEKQDHETAKKNAASARANFTYTNGENAASGFRFFNIIENAEFDDDDNITSGDIVAVVVAKNSFQASEYFLQENGYAIDLADRKRRAGRAPSKIVHTSRQYGMMLEQLCFKGGKEANGFNDNVNETHKSDWNKFYARGGTYFYYRNEDGSWKDATA